MPKECVISTPAQMEALASPVRHQIHLAMEMISPCSIKTLADRMGRDPATLYYHVNMMKRVGILVRTGMAGKGRKAEAIYSLAGEKLRVDMTQRSTRFLRALAGGCGALLRFAERNFVAAIKQDEVRKTGKARETRIGQAVARLSKESIVELNKRIDELQTHVDEADSSEARDVYVVTWCVAPVDNGD